MASLHIYWTSAFWCSRRCSSLHTRHQRTMHRDALMHPYVCKQWVVESVANSSKNTVTITNSPIVSLPRMFCMPSSWRCKRWGTYSKCPLGVIQWTQVAMNILLMMCNSAAYTPVAHWVTTQCSPPGCHVARDSWCTWLQTQNCSMQLLSPLQAMHMIQTFTCQINCVWFCPCLFHSRLDHIWNTKKMKLFSLLFVNDHRKKLQQSPNTYKRRSNSLQTDSQLKQIFM